MRGVYAAFGVPIWRTDPATGVEFDVSVTVDGSKYGVALTASAEAMLKGVEGNVFYADSPEEADAIRRGQQIDDDKTSGGRQWPAALGGR